jgi:hypothetical protein
MLPMAAPTTEFVWVPGHRKNKKQNGQRPVKQMRGQKKPKRAKKRSMLSTPINPLIVERFRRVMDCYSRGVPVDYGPLPSGTIRFLTSDASFDCTVRAYDRTLTEWLELIDTMKNGIFDSVRKEGLRFEACFQANQRLRWFARKWIIHARRKIMDRRVIGEEDLVTLLPIPSDFLVSVYDTKTRNKYKFHTNTMVRTFMSALLYSSYGIAGPQIPKNPYTNVPWTLGQIVSIVGQIMRNQALHHRLPHTVIMGYRRSGYNIGSFMKSNTLLLSITAAQSFFKTVEDPVTIEVYGEMLDDLYGEEEIPYGWRCVKRLVHKRMLSDALMKQWDDYIIAYWIYSNYRIFIQPYVNYEEMDLQFQKLNAQSIIWWKNRPRRILCGSNTISI